MDRHNFYYGRKVLDTDLNGIQDDVETSINNLPKTLSMKGIWGTLDVSTDITELWSSPNISFVIGKSLNCYDVNNKKISINLSDLISKRTASTTTVPSGNGRYYVFYVIYSQEQSDPQSPLNGGTVYYNLDDSYTVGLYVGTNNTAFNPTNTSAVVTEFNSTNPNALILCTAHVSAAFSFTKTNTGIIYREFLDRYQNTSTTLVPSLNSQYLNGDDLTTVRKRMYDISLLIG